MSPALSAVLLWHVLGGAALAVPTFLWLRRPLAGAAPSWKAGMAALGGWSAATGYAMLAMALFGISALRVPGVYESHAASGILLLAALAAHAHLRRNPPVSAAAATVIIALSAGTLGALSYQPDRYFRILTAQTSAEAKNPLFPAGTVIENPAGWAGASGRCGDASCHPTAHSGRIASAHAESASNPVYLAAYRRMVERRGPESGRWCAGCHDPASLRPGSTSRGVDCLSCHSLSALPGRAGGGHAVFTPPQPYPFARESAPAARRLHDFLLHVRPLPHRKSFERDAEWKGSSAGCLPCHRMGVTAAQNDHGFLLYDNTYGEWHSGPYSGRSLHAFTDAAERRSCTGCHPPHSEAADSGGKIERLRRAISVKVFALKRLSPNRWSERAEAFHSGRPIIVKPGERIGVDALVRNVGIGHAFPAGSPDLDSAWIETVVSDADGRVLFSSPRAKAHRYGMRALDRNGREVAPGNKADIVAHLYSTPTGIGRADGGHFHSVAPGAGDSARYTLTVPARAGRLVVTARLYLQRRTVKADRAEAMVIGEDSGELWVTGGDAKPPETRPAAAARDNRRDSEELMSYGIALFNQKDTQGARRAFQDARSRDPGDADAIIGIARTYLEEGDLLSARTNLERALEIHPNSERAKAWMGRALRAMGRYEEALAILTPLADSHPEDAITWLDIGLSHFRLGRLEAAADAFRKTLAIVPDDTGAHLNLMLCMRRLMRLTEARREEAIYLNLRGESGPAAVIDRFLAAHPDEMVERTIRHEHPLNPTR